ncbi:MAG: polynucleotide adenylyltransferase PcnB [Spirochaetota bacterium]
MLKRYKINEHGKQVAIAKVYTPHEHKIDVSSVDGDARSIIQRLQKQGFEAYVVGGAVRDLIMQKRPKDFDISTNASPKQIRKLFWNSRVIGRRFKLVHIYFQEKIFEVSTFRSHKNDAEGENNIYGTVEEDAKRRDFTINSLYYDPVDNLVLDFNDAFRDIQAGKMRSVLPLHETFIEDPVRMIRCVKYACTNEFAIPLLLDRAIKKHAQELQRSSSSRLTEEVFKILQSGHATQIFDSLIHYRLLEHILPGISQQLRGGKNKLLTDQFYESLRELDTTVMNNPKVTRGRMLIGLVDVFVTTPDEYESSLELFRTQFKHIKQVISPITPPNFEVERAVEHLFKNANIKVPKHAVRKPKTAAKPRGANAKGGRKKPRPASRSRRTPNQKKPPSSTETKDTSSS